jgi:hypothetical protein
MMTEAFLAAALFTLTLTLGADAYHHIAHKVHQAKHQLHRTGCALERIVGKHCAEKQTAGIIQSYGEGGNWPWETHTNALNEATGASDAAALLDYKLELEAALLVTNTPELREEYARVQREWSEAENLALGIR